MTYIEWATVTFGGFTFAGDGHGSGGGSFRTIHRILVETCGPQKGLIPGCEWKDTGITHRISPLPRTGKASGKTLKATVTTGRNTVTVKMEGNEDNPLVPGSPGITYHLTIVFDTKAGKANVSGSAKVVTDPSTSVQLSSTAFVYGIRPTNSDGFARTDTGGSLPKRPNGPQQRSILAVN